MYSSIKTTRQKPIHLTIKPNPNEEKPTDFIIFAIDEYRSICSKRPDQ
jgi:hypothetical protein